MRFIDCRLVPCARLVGVVAIWIGLLRPLSALDPTRRILHYGHAVWTVQNGGPRGGVFAITQTTDGWLWIGTEFGLFRFDGVRFSPWHAPAGEQLSSQIVTALASSHGGGLWVGTRNAVWFWDGVGMRHYPTTDNPKALPVSAIHEDRDGNVWVGTVGFGAGGLARIEKNRLRYFTPLDGFAGGGVLSIAEDQDGYIWIGCVEGLYRWDGRRFETFTSLGGLTQVGPLVGAQPGEIILAGLGGGLKRLVDGTLQDYPTPKFSAKIPARVLLTDRNRALWIGTTGQGILHAHNGDGDQFTHADGLSGNTVLSLFEDREGNIWVGTERGLDRFRDLPVIKLSKHDGLSDDSVGSVFAASAGGVWIGTAAGLNRIGNGNEITVYRRSGGLPSNAVGSLFEDRLAKLWIDTPRGLVYGSNGSFHSLKLPGSQQEARAISAFAEEKDGTLWLADLEQGLISVRANAIRHIVPWSSFGGKRAWALEVDPKISGVIIGFAEGGISYYREGAPLRWYTKADGLGSGAVTDLHLDREGTLWIATQGGLSQLRNGHLATLTAANGLACDQIQALIEDLDGALWLNTSCGLQAIAETDLIAWAANHDIKIQPRIYAANDGMDSRSTTNGFFRGAARSNDGRLWFPVFDGVAVVNPKSLRPNPLPPPIAVVAIRSDEHTYAIKRDLHIAPIAKELQIDYTALSFVDPDRVRFRYKLEGYDDDWRDVMGRRQAVYPVLSPRHYRFRVMAANNDGIWNKTGADVDFTVDPAIYQTLWFRILCFMAFGAIVWSTHRFRMNRLAREMNARFEGRLRERERIGRELHDTLLQNLAGFAKQLIGLSKTVWKQPQVVKELRELGSDAERLQHEIRESVWDLRDDISEEKDFYETICSTAEKVTRDAGIRLQTTVSGISPTLHPRTQRHLLRIVEEALRNAIHHAAPTEIQLTVTYTTGCQLRICIADNGCGFDLERASHRQGHWGLVTMRERADQAGAEFDLRSAPGRGTQIAIIFPRAL